MMAGTARLDSVPRGMESEFERWEMWMEELCRKCEQLEARLLELRGRL